MQYYLVISWHLHFAGDGGAEQVGNLIRAAITPQLNRHFESSNADRITAFGREIAAVRTSL